MIKKFTTLTAGLAMFSMFFGAGNVVFPLALGQFARDKNFFAILGMLMTAVGVPLLGILAATLYDGDYKQFFDRIGKIPGFIIATIIMGLLGPLGAIPRCVSLSYATLSLFVPQFPLLLFCFLSCLIIGLFAYHRSKIVNTLGYLLTPLLLVSLATIIVIGLMTPYQLLQNSQSNWEIFVKGIKDGYQTMDLLATFFFSSVVIDCLKNGRNFKNSNYHKSIILTTLRAGCIGALLLGLTYVGFSYVASFHSSSLAGVSSEDLISTIAIHILGTKAALITSIAVSIACLTTAIALASVFAEFIHKEVSMHRVSYHHALVGTLFITFFISTLNFTGIVHYLTPILQLCYPSLIVLCVLNILYKLFNFEPVKLPVFLVFISTLIVLLIK